MSDVMIEAEGLGKKYGSFVALQNASFEIRRGEILGFLGPNGAGKSTTMKILTCFIAPTTGRATINGCDIWDDPIGVRSAIGYLPERNPLYDEMLVKEYLDWIASMRGLEGDAAERRVLEVVEEVGLESKIASTVNELSKGFKQRVGLAGALLHEPPILILDEPMSGLDPNQAFEIRELIKEIGRERTVIFSTHNLAEVEVTCGRAMIIDRGRIVADDTPTALTKRTDGTYYRVTVSSSAGPDPREVFGKLRGVHAVERIDTGDEDTCVEVRTNRQDDLRSAIFDAAVETGLGLRDLHIQRQTLEEVFRELTTPDEPAMDRSDEEEE